MCKNLREYGTELRLNILLRIVSRVDVCCVNGFSVFVEFGNARWSKEQLTVWTKTQPAVKRLQRVIVKDAKDLSV